MQDYIWLFTTHMTSSVTCIETCIYFRLFQNTILRQFHDNIKTTAPTEVCSWTQ